jgi:hypothetical protein
MDKMAYVFWKDGKFWTAVIDAVVSLGLYFIGKYAPAIMDDVKIVIVALQPVVAMVMLGMFQTQQAQVARFQQKDSVEFQPPSFMAGR